jgi:hypothetical protein
VTANTLVRAIATAPDYLNSQSQAAVYNMLNLQIDSVAPMADDTIQVRWQTHFGQNYMLQVSHDLISWSDIGDPVSGNGNIATVTDDTPFASSDQRFYRVVQMP